MAQLLGNALGGDPATCKLEVVRPLVRNSILALSATAKIEKEKNRVCRVLGEAHIPYISLKGARIRPCYPKPWMRTSCNNTYEVKNYHDISLYSPSCTHLELHFSILEDTEQIQVLSQVWAHSSPVPGSDGSEYEQSPEFFLFHLIAHMAYHFVHGGCGIPHFLDLFLL